MLARVLSAAVNGIEALFSEKIGFDIGPALTDAAHALEWNVDFLRWLCAEFGLEWRAALPDIKEVNRIALTE